MIKKEYPFLVENHGGPISNYGSRFSAEVQLFAAAGYIVFYPNPRGSTSYGEEFANLLHHNYPAEDYLDVMDGVDYCIKNGIANENMYCSFSSILSDVCSLSHDFRCHTLWWRRGSPPVQKKQRRYGSRCSRSTIRATRLFALEEDLILINTSSGVPTDKVLKCHLVIVYCLL